MQRLQRQDCLPNFSVGSIAVRQKYLLPDDLIRCAKKVLPGLPSVRVGGAELGSAAKQPSQA